MMSVQPPASGVQLKVASQKLSKVRRDAALEMAGSWQLETGN